MASQHAQSLFTELAAIRPPPALAPRAGREPLDVAALLAVAEHRLGSWQCVGDRLCREVARLTQERVLLRLHSAERSRSVRRDLPADARLHRVEFAGRLCGTLAVVPDPEDPSVPALPDAQAQQLAHVCGAVVFLLEQTALLEVLCRQLEAQPPEPLTARQREVLTLMARGLSHDEIVDALHIAPETLRRHRYDLYRRLGVHSSPELLVAAHVWGLVSYIIPDV